ncbi:MAG: nucleotidyltransferase domain-containing protein [bacterium]
MTNTEYGPVPEALRGDVNRAVSILKNGGCSEIFIFGSAVSGKIRPESDIDLAVRGCSQGLFFHLLGKLLLELDQPADQPGYSRCFHSVPAKGRRAFPDRLRRSLLKYVIKPKVVTCLITQGGSNDSNRNPGRAQEAHTPRASHYY